MKCQRCENGKEAEFRVVSDILDIEVCADCAAEARRLAMTLQVVEIGEEKKDRGNREATRRSYRAQNSLNAGFDSEG